MALPVLNNAEAQASGTALAADGSNSGGANSDKFDATVTGANMTLAFDNAHAAHGATAFKVALTSTATAITYCEWTGATIGTALPRMGGACYVFLTAVPTSSLRLIAFRNGATLIGSIFIASGTGGCQFRSSADAAIGTASGNLTFNAWCRIEWDITFGGAGVATGLIRGFVGDSTTQIATDGSLAGAAFGTTAGADNVRFGANTANFSIISGTAFWLDDLNVNATGLPGPGPYTKAVAAAGLPFLFQPVPFMGR